MTPIPAGLEDENLEMYRQGDKVHALYAGSKFSYHDLPLECREPFAVELINDKAALKCLLENMTIAKDDVEEKFVWCRYGHFNEVADYSFSSNCTKPDAPGCELERTCPGFDVVCLIPQAVNGKITKQEYFVIRLIARGKQDKEIADDLKISLTTVRTYVQRIHYKLNINNRIEIFLWAKKHGIE